MRKREFEYMEEWRKELYAQHYTHQRTSWITSFLWYHFLPVFRTEPAHLVPT